MITEEEKDDLLAELANFIKSDFSSMDLVNFILDNKLAQDLLRKVSYYEYDKELNYINSAEQSTIEDVLNRHHDEFYDPYYGSEDPLMSFRVSKADLEGCESLDDLREFDNILSHLLDQLELEPVEIDKNELLCKENLDKLEKGKIDCSADQIYFFEKVSDYTEFNFYHYYRENNGSWSCNKFESDVREFDTIVDITKYDNICEAFDAYIAYFFNLFRDEFSQNTITIEYGSSLYYKYINSSIDKSVYNGLNAINQLREFVGKSFLYCWCHLQQDNEKEITDIKGKLISLIEEHKPTINTVFPHDYKSFVYNIKRAKGNEIWMMNKHYRILIDFVEAIEKRDKDIEDLKSKVHELEVRLRYEKSKNEVLELELNKMKNSNN